MLIDNGELDEFNELGAGAGQVLVNYSNWECMNLFSTEYWSSWNLNGERRIVVSG